MTLPFTLQAKNALVVHDATVRLLPAGVPNTSAYFSVKNTTDSSIAIVSASVDFAKTAELHAHVMNNDVMKMVQQDKIEISAQGTVKFVPGGLHVMIFGLNAPLSESQIVTITLITEDNHRVDVNATVVRPGNEGHKHHSHH